MILTTGEGNPNGATVRFLVDGAVPAHVEAYERLVLMFDGHDRDRDTNHFTRISCKVAGCGYDMLANDITLIRLN